MKVKKALLTKIISLFLILSCLNASSDLQAQNLQLSQKISIERGYLVELAAQAEKSSIFEKQNKALILENAQLKTKTQALIQELETATAGLAHYQKKWHYAAMLIAVFAVGLMVKIFRH